MKQFFKTSSFLALLAMLALGCKKPLDDGDPYFRFNSSEIVDHKITKGSTATVVTINVESNREWSVETSSSDPGTWYTLSPSNKRGENDGTITLTLTENIGESRTLSLRAGTMNLHEQITLVQEGSGLIRTIYAEDFGSAATGAPWPYVDQYTGWNTSGTSAGTISYTTEGSVSLRNNQASSGYLGASGKCNAMMAAAGASFIVKDINIVGANALTLTFGSNETSQTMTVSYSINNGEYLPLNYTKNTASWSLNTISFEPPAGATTMNLKFSASSTQYGARIDDLRLRGEGEITEIDYLTLSEETWTAAPGADEINITVGTNKGWTVTPDAANTWCTVTPASGEGNGSIKVSVEANNGSSARIASITVTNYNSQITKTLTVTQEVMPIYSDDFGTGAASPWPYIDAYDGFNISGTGAGNVEYGYEGQRVSVRSNAISSGYTNASGGNNVFMASTAEAAFLIKNINPGTATDFTLSFGLSSDPSVATVTCSYSTDGGSTWQPLAFTLNNNWNLYTIDFSIPEVTSSLSLKFASSHFMYGTRVDDVKLAVAE